MLFLASPLVNKHLFQIKKEKIFNVYAEQNLKDCVIRSGYSCANNWSYSRGLS